MSVDTSQPSLVKESSLTVHAPSDYKTYVLSMFTSGDHLPIQSVFPLGVFTVMLKGRMIYMQNFVPSVENYFHSFRLQKQKYNRLLE